MNHRVTGYLFFSLFSALALACTGSAKLDAKNYLSGQAAGYDEAVADAFVALDSKDYRLARESFRHALATPRHEEPNYETYLPLALAECKLGNRDVARALIKDFSCMLKIDAGNIKCPDKGVTDAFASLGGTEQCNMVMCGEIFLPYYANATDLQQARIQSLENDLSRVTKECG